MKVVQDLVTYFDRRGKLSRRELRRLLDTGGIATDAPNGMHGLCDVTGAVHYFRVTGAAEGQVWGTDTYTRDSSLGAAAVHAGLLKPGRAPCCASPSCRPCHPTRARPATASPHRIMATSPIAGGCRRSEPPVRARRKPRFRACPPLA